ncbi:unnamed protein product [Alternaria alternata]
MSGDEKQLLTSSERLPPPELPPSFSENDLDKTPDIFTFRNLQDIQYIEEKAQEAMLVLKLNTEVLEQLRMHYNDLTNHEEFPQEVSGILQHRSSKASEFYAKESRESAARMETMTLKMQDLAMKTKQETVSMRVITTVTLFFLPATFIATFMSTDILKFQNGEQELQIQGLKLYLQVALPATAMTFVAWYVIYCLARRETRQNDRSEVAGEA